MIKLSELRIGNIILKDGRPFIVDLYTFHQVFTEMAECRDFMADCESIPLNGKLFEELSFYYKDGADAYGEHRKNGCNIYEHDDIPGYFHFSLGMFHGTQVELKYLHQLQNLYFTLTGHELIETPLSLAMFKKVDPRGHDLIGAINKFNP